MGHRRTKLTAFGRQLLVNRGAALDWSVAHAAEMHDVSQETAYNHLFSGHGRRVSWVPLASRPHELAIGAEEDPAVSGRDRTKSWITCNSISYRPDRGGVGRKYDVCGPVIQTSRFDSEVTHDRTLPHETRGSEFASECDHRGRFKCRWLRLTYFIEGVVGCNGYVGMNAATRLHRCGVVPEFRWCGGGSLQEQGSGN